MKLPPEIKSQIDSIWNSFWSGGISNPLEVIEQLTYLLFIKRLDELHTLEERKRTRTGRADSRNLIFPEGKKDSKGRPYEDLRWSHFKHRDAGEMYDIVSEHVFPFIQGLGAGSSHGKHMGDARFTIPTPALLAKAVDALSEIPMSERDIRGDVYEYLLQQIASAGQNGQFRTPRHIIKLMVDMLAPTPADTICDPAVGTAGFLVEASEYIREHHPEALSDPQRSKHFHHEMFSGFDFDSTMLRISSMNLILHGVDNPPIEYRDSLSDDGLGAEASYSLIFANPPFAGSLDYDATAKELLDVTKTKKTELLFLALFIRILENGGRAAVVVPDGVLFGSTKAHKDLRRMLVEDHKLDGIVSLPSGVFKPYAGVSTAILLFTKTGIGGTDYVWFYDLLADGYSLNDRRTPTSKPEEHSEDNLRDALARWVNRDTSERERERIDQSFCVPKAEIVGNDYDLSINRYKEVVYEEVELKAPLEIIGEIELLEGKIQGGLAELKEFLT